MKILKLLIFSIWAILVFLVFFSSMEEQVVVRTDIKEKINMVFPEGWGFFTKNPRDLLIEVYKVEKDNLKKVSLSNHTFSNFLGFSRKSRIIGYEASIIANKIPKNEWKKNNSKTIEHFINDSIVHIEAEKGFKFIKKGDYIFKLYKPVPFAWAKKNQEKYNPFTYTRLRIDEL